MTFRSAIDRFAVPDPIREAREKTLQNKAPNEAGAQRDPPMGRLAACTCQVQRSVPLTAARIDSLLYVGRNHCKLRHKRQGNLLFRNKFINPYAAGSCDATIWRFYSAGGHL